MTSENPLNFEKLSPIEIFKHFSFYSTRTSDFQGNSEYLQLAMIIGDKADGNGWMIYFCEDIAHSAGCRQESSHPCWSTASGQAGIWAAEVEQAWCWLTAFGRAGEEACDADLAALAAEGSELPGRFRS